MEREGEANRTSGCHHKKSRQKRRRRVGKKKNRAEKDIGESGAEESKGGLIRSYCKQNKLEEENGRGLN